MLLMKNPQFLSKYYETLSNWPSHGKVKLPKFELDQANIEDFSLIAYFRASLIFYYPVSIMATRWHLLSFFIIKREKKFDPRTPFEARLSDPKTTTLPTELSKQRDFAKKNSFTGFPTSLKKIEKKNYRMKNTLTNICLRIFFSEVSIYSKIKRLKHFFPQLQ